MSAPTTTLAERMKAVLDERSMLQHPFYRAWTEGRLAIAQLQEYARQYYRFEAAFPRYLSAIHARTESPTIRQALLDNLWDEEHGERNHAALWLDFAAALGLSRDEVTGASVRPETGALVDHFQRACQEVPVAEALATLYAYEGQVPAIAWEKIKGLTDHYGFTPEGFEFFSVHLVSDIAHAGAEANAIAEACTDADAVVRATEVACDHLLRFLDGCAMEASA
jgi:pyrroloquinoline-quinone synthase